MRVCVSCGRLWSSAVRRRFGERCPECEAEAAQTSSGAGGGGRRRDVDAVVPPRSPRFSRALPSESRPDAPESRQPGTDSRPGAPPPGSERLDRPA